MWENIIYYVVMKALEIKIGTTFSKMTIVKEVERKQKTKRRFLCKCDCGETRGVNLISLTRGQTKSCGCSSKDWHRRHKGKLNPNWKGGERIESNGYVEVYLPTHPASRQTGYVKKHRWLMEQKIGRQLLSEENVHHKNGDKTDNRIENLELWNTSQPCGQRVEDKVAWAKKILEIYG